MHVGPGRYLLVCRSVAFVLLSCCGAPRRSAAAHAVPRLPEAGLQVILQGKPETFSALSPTDAATLLPRTRMALVSAVHEELPLQDIERLLAANQDAALAETTGGRLPVHLAAGQGRSAVVRASGRCWRRRPPPPPQWITTSGRRSTGQL